MPRWLDTQKMVLKSVNAPFGSSTRNSSSESDGLSDAILPLQQEPKIPCELRGLASIKFK